MQAVVAVAATTVGFAPSLLSLASGFPDHLVTGAIGLVPVIAILLAGLIAWRPSPPGPEIHDRYLDYILGLALLGLATTTVLFLPQSLSLFFWSWRLDMLALPLFLAGAVTLLCGSRTLWRYRLPLAFLFLAWPLPYAATAISSRMLPLELIALCAAGVFVALSILRRGRRRSRREPERLSSPRPAGRLLAGALLMLSALLTLSADRQLGAAMRLLRADGQPRMTSSAQPPAAIDGFPLGATTPAGLPTWGPPANQALFEYGTEPLITVDRLQPPDARDLELPPGTIAALQGYRLQTARSVDLGSALRGQLESYTDANQGRLLQIVWWDWPVASPAGVARQRVIVERSTQPGVSRAGSGDQLLTFARDLVASEAAAAAPGS